MNIPLTTPVPFTPGFTFPEAKICAASIGSCFSEKVIEILRLAGTDCLSNPNGIVYNPVSIQDSVEHAVSQESYPDDNFIFQNGLWHSLAHHGAFSRPDKTACQKAAAESSAAFGVFLKKANLVILTPGTAVVFRYLKTNRITANCHKIPGTEFSRELLSFQACTEALQNTLKVLKKSCPETCRFVLSVSPVRHHPGDPVLNMHSKALLVAACHEAAAVHPQAVYFPAYEILNDELRDYRFYTEDMVHPSPLAEKIIVRRFLNGCFGGIGDEILQRALAKAASAVHIPMKRS